MNIKEEILQRTNRGVDIFYIYMPIDFVPKRNFRNPLYETIARYFKGIQGCGYFVYH